MYFNSFTFILVFLPVVWLGYQVFLRYCPPLAAKLWLIASSLYFYGYWNPKYLVLIVGSIVFNYMMGRLIAASPWKSRWLTLAITINLMPLCFYKYLDFGLQTFNSLFDAELPLFGLILPLAISFFTFQQIAYVVDCYKGIKNEPNFVDYCLFVCFFPQLIAGPIVHHQEITPQFAATNKDSITAETMAKGIFVFAIGLFKKVIIADNLAPLANVAYDFNISITFLDTWLATLVFYLQLYFDFSGYTDMATGSALMFNIKLPLNFNSPIKSLSMQDFFRRWHITLSRWLGDYIYRPLGGHGKNQRQAAQNITITFLLGGIWHGAGWNFVMWGLVHAGGFLIFQLWRTYGRGQLPKIIAWSFTFYYACYTAVYFKAKTATKGHEFALRMAGLDGVELPRKWEAFLPSFGGYFRFTGATVLYRHNLQYILMAVGVLMFTVLYFRNSNQQLESLKPKWYTALWVAILLTTCIIFMLDDRPDSFLYFQF